MAKLNSEEYNTFESIKQSKDGNEFWNARELATVLQYKNWQNFVKVIDRAMLACKNSGYAVSDHFIEVNKMVTGALTMPRIGGHATWLREQEGE